MFNKSFKYINIRDDLLSKVYKTGKLVLFSFVFILVLRDIEKKNLPSMFPQKTHLYTLIQSYRN